MALHLFGKPRRRSRSSSSGMGKGVETVMTIAAIGALGVGAYFVLKSGKGAEEFLQTGGDFMKDLVDAANSSGEAIGNASCHIQALFKPGLNCGAGYRFPGSKSSSSKDESKGIVDGLKDAVGGYYKGVEKEIQDNEDRSLINRKGISDFFMGLGCGVIRKC